MRPTSSSTLFAEVDPRDLIHTDDCGKACPTEPDEGSQSPSGATLAIVEIEPTGAAALGADPRQVGDAAAAGAAGRRSPDPLHQPREHAHLSRCARRAWNPKPHVSRAYLVTRVAS